MNKPKTSQMVNRNGELAEEILRLKRQRSAIILAHNYQRGEVQDMAPEVRVTEEIRVRAKRAVDKMLEIGRVN